MICKKCGTVEPKGELFVTDCPHIDVDRETIGFTVTLTLKCEKCEAKLKEIEFDTLEDYDYELFDDCNMDNGCELNGDFFENELEVIHKVLDGVDHYGYICNLWVECDKCGIEGETVTFEEVAALDEFEDC